MFHDTGCRQGNIPDCFSCMCNAYYCSLHYIHSESLVVSYLVQLVDLSVLASSVLPPSSTPNQWVSEYYNLSIPELEDIPLSCGIWLLLKWVAIFLLGDVLFCSCFLTKSLVPQPIEVGPRFATIHESVGVLQVTLLLGFH